MCSTNAVLPVFMAWFVTILGYYTIVTNQAMNKGNTALILHILFVDACCNMKRVCRTRHQKDGLIQMMEGEKKEAFYLYRTSS
jgi:hypothetical protein